jgi:hypothetical protein
MLTSHFFNGWIPCFNEKKPLNPCFGWWNQKKNTEAPVLAGASLLASLGFLCPGGGERWEKMGSVISNEYIYIYLFIYIDIFVYLSSYLSIYLYLIMWVTQSLKPPIWYWFRPPICGHLGDGLLLFYPHYIYIIYLYLMDLHIICISMCVYIYVCI